MRSPSCLVMWVVGLPRTAGSVGCGRLYLTDHLLSPTFCVLNRLVPGDRDTGEEEPALCQAATVLAGIVG